MRKFLFGKGGFTIIELMVTLVLIGIVSASLCTVLYGNWSSYDREISAADRQLEVRTAIDKIVRDIRESEDITVNADSLVLTLEGVNVVYQINDNNNLTRQEGDQPARVLCEYVDRGNSGFQWSGPKSVDIDIQLVQPEKIFNRSGAKEVEARLRCSAQRRHL